MEEYGQPMHAYDLDTIEDREIVVRRAAKGEQFVTLEMCIRDRFNFEGGCYAKVIGLDKESEPDIYNAIKRNALLENVTAVSYTHLDVYKRQASYRANSFS